ncbi:MAG: C-GCAxxG-C-C family protein [Eubacteriales bacterium]|nr:C-GCAxxG-C-C family protein [Eubacteriales bacterium]
MSKYVEKAKELRAVTEIHYNCAQSVLVPFAEDAGISEEAAMKIASNFGAGMRRASTCGAITGGLMVLGLFGIDNVKVVGEYHRRLKEKHEGYLDCADLLRVNKEQGREKKLHCDEMVYECVELAEELIKEYKAAP